MFSSRVCYSTLFFWMTVGLVGANNKTSPLNGRHLAILPVNAPPGLTITRNSSGHIIEMTGSSVPMLHWLSESQNFTFEMIQDVVFFVENGAGGKKGMMSYLIEGKADILYPLLTVTSNRFLFMDFPYTWASNQLAAMMPAPKPTNNLDAEWKPFQPQVWVYLLISIALTVASLYCLHRCISSRFFQERIGLILNYSRFDHLDLVIDYVVGILLSQGRTSPEGKLVIRLLAGSWCLTCFVLVTAYSSVLISFITSPNYEPLIKSVYDVITKPKIRVTVDKGLGPDVIFTTAEDGICKLLGDRLRQDPSHLRCNTTDLCVERVRKGSTIYIQSYPRMLDIIGRDLMTTGRCDFTVAEEKFMLITAGMATAKKSPYTEYISRELLKMEAAGMINRWRMTKPVTIAERCVKKIIHSHDEKHIITMNDLSGAFAIILAGYILSFLSHTGEQIWRKNCRKNREIIVI